MNNKILKSKRTRLRPFSSYTILDSLAFLQGPPSIFSINDFIYIKVLIPEIRTLAKLAK